MAVATADAKNRPMSDVAMRVSGPAALNVIAGLKGSETMTRVDIRPSESQVVLEAGGKAISFPEIPGPSDQMTVIYIISGPRTMVERKDGVFRQFWTMLGSENASRVSKFLANLPLLGRSRSSARTKHMEASRSVEAPEPSAVESWATLKEALLRDNRFESGPNLGRMLGSRARNTSEIVSKLRRDGKIFAVDAGGQDLFPLFQFQENKPNPAVAQVLAALTPKLSPWAIMSWFCTPDEWTCAGRSPKELLEREPDAVIEAARHRVAPSWD